VNRESAVLLPLLFGAIWIERMPIWKCVLVAGGMFLVYGICQWLISFTTADNMAVSFYSFGGMWLEYKGNWQVNVNMEWLLASCGNIWIWLSNMAWMPVLFVALVKGMPGCFRRFGLVTWVYGAMLLFVGLVPEARLWGEMVAILYIPVGLGVLGMMRGEAVWDRFLCVDGQKKGPNWLGWCEGAVAVLTLLAVVGGILFFRHLPIPR